MISYFIPLTDIRKNLKNRYAPLLCFDHYKKDLLLFALITRFDTDPTLFGDLYLE